MPKLAAIYARVSSMKQKEGENVQSQISALLSFAADRGYTIPEGWIFKDEGFSGSTLQRPALDEMRVQIHEGEVNAVLIYSPDRLSRKYAYQLLLEMEFQKCATELIFFNTPQAVNPEDQLSLHFKAIFAEYERAQITERCRRGRLYRAKQGSVSVIPTAPYGYVYEKKNEFASYTIEKEKANIVRKIYFLYTSEQMSIREIARTLELKGIKSPRNNLKWHLSTIRDILRNSAYIGTAYFGKSEKIEGFSEKIIRTKKGRIDFPPKSRKWRPKEMWISISVPAIIEEKVFLEAQERLDINQQLASRNTKKISILQGLLVCGLCGSPYYKKIRRSNGKNFNYYCCSNRLKSGNCKNISFKQENLEKAIWEYTTQLLKNPQLIEEEIERRICEVSEESKMHRRCHEIEKEILRLKKAKDKLLDAFQDGECLTIDELRIRVKVIDQQKIAWEKELKGLQALTLQKEQNAVLKNSIECFQKCLSEDKTLSIKEKQRVLRLLISQIVLTTEKIEVHHSLPIMQNGPLQPDRYCNSPGNRPG